MSYRIVISKRAKSDLANVQQRDRIRIEQSLYLLSQNPIPPKSKKLTGLEARRVRVGDYRIVYEIIQEQLVVYVIRVGHRSDVYREL